MYLSCTTIVLYGIVYLDVVAVVFHEMPRRELQVELVLVLLDHDVQRVLPLLKRNHNGVQAEPFAYTGLKIQLKGSLGWCIGGEKRMREENVSRQLGVGV